MRPSATRFAVVTTPRSGSTWLLELLNSHPGVAAFEELFLDRPVRERYAHVAAGSPPRFRERRKVVGARPMAVFRYLAEVHEYRAGAQATGFKLMTSHIRALPELVPAMLRHRYRLIGLKRANLFENCVSLHISKASGVAHQAGPRGEAPPVEIDAGALVRDMTGRRRALAGIDALLGSWPCPVLKLAYEDLAADPQAACDRIFGFLGLEPAPVEGRLAKIVTRPYRETIGNYTEVAAALAAAGLGAHLRP